MDISFKNILESAAGSFLGGALVIWITVGWSGIRLIRSKLGRPNINIETKRTPKNIFSAIELGSSAHWIQEQLGHPNKIRDSWWGYRFSDALVSLDFDSNMALETISVALVGEKENFPFPTIHFDCPPIGKAMLSDVSAEHLQLEYINSLRHQEIIVFGREGPPGAWHYITFGVLDPAVPGVLLPSEFKWDSDTNLLVTSQEQVKINWAAISSRLEPAHFPWHFALNLQSF